MTRIRLSHRWPSGVGVALLLTGTLVRPAAAGTTYKVSTAQELEAAIGLVNATPPVPGEPEDRVVLAPGTYKVARPLTCDQPVTIEGDPVKQTVLDGGGASMILLARARVSIRSLTLQNGAPAIGVDGGGHVRGEGLTITGSNPGVSADSGGITLTNATVANNAGNGLEISCATLRLTNVTVSDNEIGVYFAFPCGERMQIINSLIVRNRQGDCAADGSFDPVGDTSFDGDGSCVAAGFARGLTTMPLSVLGLGPLAPNGGPTWTEAISAESRAATRANNSVCPTLDQRGFLRAEDTCDIGAYEHGALPVNTPPGSNVSVSPAPGIAVIFSEVTAAGATTVTTGGPPPPAGFQVDGVVYDISTTAVFTGPVTVCLPYSTIPEPLPRLFHYEDIPPPAWVDRTGTWNNAAQLVCGTVASLSPFAVLMPDHVTGQSPLEAIAEELAAIVAARPGTKLARRIEDVLGEVRRAAEKQDDGDRHGSAGEIEAAVGGLEATVKHRLIGEEVARPLQDRLTAVSWLMARQAIDAAVARGGCASRIAQARKALQKGEEFGAAGQFKQAASRYTSAIAKAGSA